MNMFAHIKGATPRSRVLLASIVATGVLLVPLGTTASPSGASSSSSFCTQYRAWLEGKLHAPISATGVPTTKTAAAWHTFGKKAEPIFAQMAADAPNTKIKTRLDGIITIWKYYAKTTSAANLASFFNAHQTQWNGWYLIGQLSAEEACS
jgi:hypothetical protein